MSVVVTLIRHGRTTWNAEGRLLGWRDEPLDGEGRAQAAEIRHLIATTSYRATWSSDLDRAVETARLAGREPTTVPGLRELDFGALEGSRWVDLDEPTRDALVAFDDFVAPDGESVRDLVERVVAFLDGLEAGAHLVVTHGGVIRAVLRACGESDGFPRHGGAHVIDWTNRRVVQVPTR